MRRIRVFGLMYFLLSGGSCASQTTKVLNESNAQALLRERLRSEDYKIAVTNLEPLMRRSMNDYATLAPPAVWEAVLKRLLERKLVEQHVSVVSYPKISGLFTERSEFA